MMKNSDQSFAKAPPGFVVIKRCQVLKFCSPSRVLQSFDEFCHVFPFRIPEDWFLTSPSTWSILISPPMTCIQLPGLGFQPIELPACECIGRVRHFFVTVPVGWMDKLP
jgi:hypothetical protein